MSADEHPINTPERGQFLTFSLGKETYGVDILRVQEIRGWVPVRCLPDAPDYVKGVLDLRGAVVPIVDLRVRFGEQHPAYEFTTVVVILSVKDLDDDSSHLIGIVVDGVSDVLDVQGAELMPPPRLAGSIRQRYLRGMVSLERGLVVLLDIDRMLSELDFADLEVEQE